MIPWLEVYLNVSFMDHCYTVHNQSVFEASMYRQRSWFIKKFLFYHSNCWLSACLSFSLSLYFLKLKWLIRESHQVFRELFMQICALLYWITMHILLEVSERKCERNIFAKLHLDILCLHLVLIVAQSSHSALKKAQFWHFMLDRFMVVCKGW